MKYSCISCNYSTNDSGNWTRHNKTKSHLKKVTNQSVSLKKRVDDKDIGSESGSESGFKSKRKVNIATKEKIFCPYCDKNFSTKSNLSRHIKYRCSEIDDKSNDNFSNKSNDNFSNKKKKPNY